MNLKWFRGLSVHDKKLLRQDLAAAKPAFERLALLLEEEYLQTVEKMENKKNFALDWKNYQASLIGELKAIKTLKQFIKE